MKLKEARQIVSEVMAHPASRRAVERQVRKWEVAIADALSGSAYMDQDEDEWDVNSFHVQRKGGGYILVASGSGTHTNYDPNGNWDQDYSFTATTRKPFHSRYDMTKDPLGFWADLLARLPAITAGDNKKKAINVPWHLGDTKQPPYPHVKYSDEKNKLLRLNLRAWLDRQNLVAPMDSEAWKSWDVDEEEHGEGKPDWTFF